jgi:hypothetical protein
VEDNAEEGIDVARPANRLDGQVATLGNPLFSIIYNSHGEIQGIWTCLNLAIQ